MNSVRPAPDEEARFQVFGQASRPDLLVLGGGVLGLSTACEVLSRGLSVTLFEDDCRRSATWNSGGMLSPYAEQVEEDALQDMMRAARAAYPTYVARIQEQSGLPVELAFPGTLLLLAGAEDPGRAMTELAEHFRGRGANCRYLGTEELEEEEPLLGPKDAGAILLEDEGYVNSRSLLTALRAAFDHLGGRCVALPALGLASRQGRVAGVETAAGVVLGGAVLNAAGAWAERFLMPEDQERFRARPIRGQLVRLRPPSRPHSIRRVLHMPGTGYLVPHADGSVLAGTTSENVGPFLGNTAGGVAQVLAAARLLVPRSSEWAYLRASSGLRPMAGDGELFLEADSARKGLFHGLGLYRHGILLAPMAAMRLARLVLEYLGHQG